jgi:hypothetical protein
VSLPQQAAKADGSRMNSFAILGESFQHLQALLPFEGQAIIEDWTAVHNISDIFLLGSVRLRSCMLGLLLPRFFEKSILELDVLIHVPLFPEPGWLHIPRPSSRYLRKRVTRSCVSSTNM